MNPLLKRDSEQVVENLRVAGLGGYADTVAELIRRANLMQKALEECREYFDDVADCDHNGITFVENRENKLLNVVDEAILDWVGME